MSIIVRSTFYPELQSVVIQDIFWMVFLCLMRQHSNGTISYDLRERDQRIESETAYCQVKIKEIIDFLDGLDQEDALHFEVNYADHIIRTSSCLTRELIHNIEHVIHHLAIVKIALLQYHSEIQLPPSFGVAPSTLRYWKETGVEQTDNQLQITI